MSNIFNPRAPSQSAPAPVQQAVEPEPDPLVRDAGEVDTTRRTNARKRSRTLLDLLLDDDLSPTTL